MGRVAPNFRQRDVTAAIRAVRNAGYEVGKVEIDPKTRMIVILPERRDGKVPAPDDKPEPERNEWDE